MPAETGCPWRIPSQSGSGGLYYRWRCGRVRRGSGAGCPAWTWNFGRRISRPAPSRGALGGDHWGGRWRRISRGLRIVQVVRIAAALTQYSPAGGSNHHGEHTRGLLFRGRGGARGLGLPLLGGALLLGEDVVQAGLYAGHGLGEKRAPSARGGHCWADDGARRVGGERGGLAIKGMFAVGVCCGQLHLGHRGAGRASDAGRVRIEA